MKETHAKFTLKYSYVGSEDYSPMDITFEIPGDSTVDQMLFNFECFLKACGYIFDGSFVQSHPEDKYEGCMADWDDDEEDSPTFHDTLSTAICEDAKKKKSCCGLEETSSPCETSTWDEQFDVTKTTHLSDSISTEEYQKQQIKKGLAKLEAEIKAERDKEMEAYKEAIKEAEDKYPVNILYKKIGTLNSEAEIELKKNKWFHGLCNPPSPDWKKSS